MQAVPKTTRRILRDALLAGCLTCWGLVSAQAAIYTGVVTVVRDGDSVQVTTDSGDKIEVRLHAIDAPEKKYQKRRGQPFADQARDTLNRLAWRKRAIVETSASDEFGRRIGILSVETGNGAVDAGLLQLQLGMAWTFPRALSELPDDLRASYRYAEAIARMKRRGLWADEKPQPPWQWRARGRATLRRQ
jgi:endonuclease YncB( thermonuclease family)